MQIPPHMNDTKTEITHYTCTIRATKTEKGHGDVQQHWCDDGDSPC